MPTRACFSRSRFGRRNATAHCTRHENGQREKHARVGMCASGHHAIPHGASAVESACSEGSVETWTMTLPRDQSVHQVVNPNLTDEQIEGVSEQLSAILHSDMGI